MEYDHINNFFDKFKKIIYQKQEIKKTIQDVVSRNISFKLDDGFFNYKNGIIHLRCSPVIKNEIIIHKETILKDLKKELGQSFYVYDIK